LKGCWQNDLHCVESFLTFHTNNTLFTEHWCFIAFVLFEPISLEVCYGWLYREIYFTNSQHLTWVYEAYTHWAVIFSWMMSDDTWTIFNRGEIIYQMKEALHTLALYWKYKHNSVPSPDPKAPGKLEHCPHFDGNCIIISICMIPSKPHQNSYYVADETASVSRFLHQ